MQKVRHIKMMKKDPRQILKVKATVYKVKNRLGGIKGRLDTEDEKICETEDRVAEII